MSGDAELSQRDFDFVREFVFRRSAIALELDKAYLVKARLQPLVREHGLDSLHDLIERLRKTGQGSLETQVVNAMTTNETSFFRDAHVFETLRAHVLPELAASHPGPITIWSAACASGQEAYSLLMMIHESLPALRTRVRVHCTDLSSDMVERVKDGSYRQLEVSRGLPSAYLSKYFTQQGTEWQIAASLRKQLEVRQMNLAEPFPAMPKMDLVLLRNVLIYFDMPTKRRILEQTRRCMRTPSVLVLGGSESTLNIDSRFRRVSYGATQCYWNADAAELGHHAA